MISERLQRLKYVAGDLLMSNVAWLAYNCLRYELDAVHGRYPTLGRFLTSSNVEMGQLVFPLVMMCVYGLSGYYNEVFRKSRLHEFFVTLWSSVVNALIIFFVALINDVSNNRSFDYEMVFILVVVLFVCVYGMRSVITTHTSGKIRRRQWSFNTLIVGCGAQAVAFGRKLDDTQASLGYKIMGYVSIPGEDDEACDQPRYSLDEIERVCDETDIKEIIVVPTTQHSESVLNTINRLFALNRPIKLPPERMGMLLSKVRISDMIGAPLVDISSSNMGACGTNLKRLIDVIASALLTVLLLPVYLIVAILIKCDSRGPVFYTQERMGYHNKPFKIIKFRTMVCNAEENGQPQLSSDNDPRITRVGRVLRKYRIDELPQFWNVLRGDMSIVGPRPERQYFIEQILKRVPAYALLRQVRPGITSLGMVKFGYAKNVDEMVERLNYDILYLENMSLLNDFKILVYTIKVVLTGRGV